VVTYLCKYFKLSSREIEDYLEILTIDEVKLIIQKFGVDKKEIDKWLK
jgi:abortive infection bacteriophage resistance protein